MTIELTPEESIRISDYALAYLQSDKSVITELDVKIADKFLKIAKQYVKNTMIKKNSN